MEFDKGQELYSWGMNKLNSLGTNKTDTDESQIHKMPHFKENIIQVSTGGLFGACISSQGDLYVWGSSTKGRLGVQNNQEFSPIQKINLQLKINQVACGDWHTLVLSQNTVLSTGHNGYGQLGLNDKQDRFEFTLIPDLQHTTLISAGSGFSCAISQNELFSCGFRSRHGHPKDEHITKFKKLKDLYNIVEVNCGYVHSCAINQQGQVYSWGNGIFYQLGHGSKEDQKVPKLVESIQNIQIVTISCSRGEKKCHTGAIDVNGQVYTWGSGYKGKLGHEKSWTHDNPADQPVPKKIEAINIKMKKIQCGGIHTCLLSEEGQVYSFGCGSNGRIGHPEFANYVYLYREGLPRQIDFFKGKKVIDLACSYYHNTCIC